jgi:hypothetical protein
MTITLHSTTSARAISYGRTVVTGEACVTQTTIVRAFPMTRADRDWLEFVHIGIDSAVLTSILFAEVTMVAGIALAEAALSCSSLATVSENRAIFSFESDVTYTRPVMRASTLTRAAVRANRGRAACTVPALITQASGIFLAYAVPGAVTRTRQFAAVITLPPKKACTGTIGAHTIARARRVKRRPPLHLPKDRAFRAESALTPMHCNHRQLGPRHKHTCH